MILTVTPNPALDLTYDVDALALGSSHRVDAPRVRAGGKGINVTRVLAARGIAVEAVLPLGGEVGDTMRADLRRSGIAHTGVPVTPETRRTLALVDHAGGDTTQLNERGGGLSPLELDDLRQQIRARLADADCLTGSGSLPPDCPSDFYAGLVADAHAAGAVAIIDTVGPALMAACEAGADLVKPNRDELAETLGLADPIAGACRLIELGARRVIVTLGADGMVGLNSACPQVAVRARLPRVLRGNPTGAGDAAVAAAAASLTSGSSFPELLRLAAAWSAAAVLAPLAGELSPEADALLREVIITEEPSC